MSSGITHNGLIFTVENETVVRYSTEHKNLLYVLKESGVYTHQFLSKPPVDSLRFDTRTREVYQADHSLRDIKNDYLLLFDYAFEGGGPKEINNIILLSLNNKDQLEIKPPAIELYGMGVLETFISKDGEYILLKTHTPTGSALFCYSSKTKDWKTIPSYGNAAALTDYNEIVSYDSNTGRFLFFDLDNFDWSKFYVQAPIIDPIIDATIKDKILTVAYNGDGSDTILLHLNLSNGKVIDNDGKKLIHQIDSSFWDNAYNHVDKHEEVLYFLENGKASSYGYRNNIYYLSKDKTLSQITFNKKLGTLIFENKEKKERAEQVVYFRGNKNGAFIFFTPDHFYFGSERLSYPFKSYAQKYNRPDIVLDRLGYAD